MKVRQLSCLIFLLCLMLMIQPCAVKAEGKLTFKIDINEEVEFQLLSKNINKIPYTCISVQQQAASAATGHTQGLGPLFWSPPSIYLARLLTAELPNISNSRALVISRVGNRMHYAIIADRAGNGDCGNAAPLVHISFATPSGTTSILPEPDISQEQRSQVFDSLSPNILQLMYSLLEGNAPQFIADDVFAERLPVIPLALELTRNNPLAISSEVYGVYPFSNGFYTQYLPPVKTIQMLIWSPSNYVTPAESFSADIIIHSAPNSQISTGLNLLAYLTIRGAVGVHLVLFILIIRKFLGME